MNASQVALLKMLFRSPTFDALVVLRDELSERWRASSASSLDEWDYIRGNLIRDGRLEGIGLLFGALQELAGEEGVKRR